MLNAIDYKNICNLYILFNKIYIIDTKVNLKKKLKMYNFFFII